MNRILKNRKLGQGISLFLVFALFTGCAGTSQRGASTSAKAAAQPVSVPQMYKGRVVNVQKFLPVRTQPSLSATETGRLRPGDTVTITKEQDEWYTIAAPDENSPQLQGWVMKKYVEKGEPILPPPPPQAEQSDSDEQKDVDGMKKTTTVQGAIVGTLVGAALGALIGLATGDSKNIAKGALIGAGAGLATGLVAGVYVANQKEKYANNEEYLDACIKEARQYNEAATKANQDLSEAIRLTELSIIELQTKVNDASSRRRQASKNVASLKQANETGEKNIAAIEGEIIAQEKALQQASGDKSGRAAALEKELVKMRVQLAEMKAKRARLNDLNAEMSKMAL